MCVCLFGIAVKRKVCVCMYVCVCLFGFAVKRKARGATPPLHPPTCVLVWCDPVCKVPVEGV